MRVVARLALCCACLGSTLAGLGWSQASSAQDYYVGQVFWMATQFCPRYSLPADGRILPIALNTTLFSLLGTNYGGDGVSTFALPDLRGRVPMGVGNGAGDPDRVLAQRGRTVKGKHASTADDAKNPILTLPYLVLQPCIVTDGIFPTQW